ncbi:MAG TPA: trigger factor [Thermoanaerobaculia bacterium]|nr:trigger factor [Thermoanaerobaculia bacterium]
MLISYEELSSVKKVMEVEIPAELVEAESRRVTSEYGRQVKVPGFRPGKVPASVVRSGFGKEIQDEILNRLLPLSFREILTEKGLETVGEPHVENVSPLIDGAPVKYKVEFEVKPQFDLREYRGLETDDPKIEVTDEDVDKMVERFREQASVYRQETERGLEDGDFAVIDITATPEGGEPKTEGGHFRLGEESPLPELHDALRGRKPGEQVSFDKTYDETAKNEEFRGKSVRHDVTLKEIRVQEKPEVNDDLAKSAGGWDSVAVMREAISKEIRHYREHEAQELKRKHLGDRLVADHHFEAPDAMVAEEVNRALNRYASFMASQGVDVEKAEIDWNKMGEEFRPDAVKRAKRSLILEAIARKESLTVSDVEVDAEVRRASKEADRDFAEVKHRLRHDGGYESLRESLLRDRALDLVVKESRAREP